MQYHVRLCFNWKQKTDIWKKKVENPWFKEQVKHTYDEHMWKQRSLCRVMFFSETRFFIIFIFFFEKVIEQI